MDRNDDLLWDLLAEWEEARNQGHEIPVEVLAQNHPELLDLLKEHVQALKTTDWLTRPSQDSDVVPDFKPFVVGEYTVVGLIGVGGMGEVYQALHRRMDRFVALKLLPSHLHHEVKSAAKLTHPNIVTAFDAGEHQGRPFLVMELIDGCDLQRHVREHGPLPVEQAVDCIVQAARGLGYAHEQGIVHGDVKPANLILSKDGVVKVLDLGLARSSTEATGITGTVDYLAPEKTEEPYRADHRTDIYALGCTLHFLLTGKPVFDGRTALEKIVAHRETPAPTLPSPVNAVFQKMVAKKPEDRYQSMAEVIQALAKKQVGRNTLWWVAGLLVVVLAGFALYQLNSPPPPTPVVADRSKEAATVSKDRSAEHNAKRVEDRQLLQGAWITVVRRGLNTTALGRP